MFKKIKLNYSSGTLYINNFFRVKNYDYANKMYEKNK